MTQPVTDSQSRLTHGVKVLRLLSPVEWGVLLAGLVGWLCLITCGLTPPAGSTDVYCFRDPAINLLLHRGFTTASYVLSRSFRPVLYSTNTPLSGLTYLPFAWIFGAGSTSAQLYYLTLAAIADAACVLLILRIAPRGRIRTVLIFLLALTLPFGLLGSELDRPENLSFLLLLLLLLVLGRQKLSAIAVAGTIAGIAFLSEPFAGVVGGLLTAGAVFCGALEAAQATTARAHLFLTRSIWLLLWFLIPIAATAGIFFRQDPGSLNRFLHHADFVVSRGTKGGDPVTSLTGDGTDEHLEVGLSRYGNAVRFYRMMGPVTMLRVGVFALILLAWIGLCFRAKGKGRSRLALFGLGAILLVLPVVAFPVQENYLILDACLIPFTLLLNWCGCTEALRDWRCAAVLALAADLLVLLPGGAIRLMQGIEGRRSYEQAQAQVRLLHAYLLSHYHYGNVVLVPASEYYLYKPLIPDIFNPDYLSPDHDPQQVEAVVNCNRGTKYFAPLEQPLPQIAEGSGMVLIAAGVDQVPITLFHRRVMSRNWTWSCDIYVRP
ncbi:MAG: hypothetical protein WBW84_24235 [Acidobacteriaceae bacterium]